MGTSLSVTLVETDGRIDADKSRAAFDTVLSNLIAERDVEVGQIASAVEALFDTYKGKPIAMPALASMAAQKLNAQPENFKTLSERVLDYVRANSKGDSSLFVIGKGKGGGCYRRADAPVKA